MALPHTCKYCEDDCDCVLGTVNPYDCVGCICCTDDWNEEDD